MYSLVLKLAQKGDVECLQTTFNLDKEAAFGFIQNSQTFLRPYLKGIKLSINGIKRDFDSLRSQIKTKKFHLSRFITFTYPGKANVAVSSMTNPEYDLYGKQLIDLNSKDEVPYIPLTILPTKKETFIIFHYHKRFENLLSIFWNQLTNLDYQERAVIISKFIIINCENAVYSPKYVESLKDEEKAAIENAFGKTAEGAIPFAKVPDINFFILT